MMPACTVLHVDDAGMLLLPVSDAGMLLLPVSDAGMHRSSTSMPACTVHQHRCRHAPPPCCACRHAPPPCCACRHPSVCSTSMLASLRVFNIDAGMLPVPHPQALTRMSDTFLTFSLFRERAESDISSLFSLSEKEQKVTHFFTFLHFPGKTGRKSNTEGHRFAATSGELFLFM